jgi:hypothetical protein
MAPIKLSRDQPPYDELSIPEADLEKCPDCERWYPTDSWHRCATNAIGDVPSDIEAEWSE